MSKSTASSQKTKLHTDYALLALIGQHCQTQNLLAPLHQLVKIEQKTLVHSPTQKLQDALLAILCGAEAVSQINTTLRAEPALQKAWGRDKCADQSSVQQTLSACTSQNIEEMQQVLQKLFGTFSRASKHDYTNGPLILDIDLTGLPCSSHYEGATKGYFAGAKRGTTGRQLVRVSASQYDEIVYHKVYPGNTGSADLDLLKTALLATLQILGLSKKPTGQVLLRLDGGFGTTAIIEYLLEQGYQFVLKLHSGTRSKKWDEAVAEASWYQDANKNGQRWVSCLSVANPYTNPQHHKVWLIGVRCLKSDKDKDKKAKPSSESNTASTYAYSVLAVRTEQLAGKEALSKEKVLEQLLEQLDFYDDRATIESASFRGDKQGLKLAKRRKYSLAGQEMLILLAQLAHNLIAWAKGWLGEAEPRLAEFGIKVSVRDLFTMKGRLTFVDGQIVKVRLRRGLQYARRFFETLAIFFAKSGIRLILSET